MAKWVSLIVKFGALAFIVFVPSKYAIYLQLLGGIWIIQTLPAVMLGVYTRWLNDWALLIGWRTDGGDSGAAQHLQDRTDLRHHRHREAHLLHHRRGRAAPCDHGRQPRR